MDERAIHKRPEQNFAMEKKRQDTNHSNPETYDPSVFKPYHDQKDCPFVSKITASFGKVIAAAKQNPEMLLRAPYYRMFSQRSFNDRNDSKVVTPFGSKRYSPRKLICSHPNGDICFNKSSRNAPLLRRRSVAYPFPNANRINQDVQSNRTL